MALSIINPYGSANAIFGSQALMAGVRWDSGFSHGVDLAGNDLTVINRGGSGQGTCVSPEIAQSTGKLYWEIQWTGLISTVLAGGISVCTIEAIDDYASLAADGTGGVVLRPDGTIWAQGVDTGGFLAIQAEGDTVGVLLDFVSDPAHPSVVFLGVGGTVVNISTGDFLVPAGNYIPAAVFDSASVFDVFAQTANFDRNNPGSFLGPIVYPDLFTDVTPGWPNTA